MNCTICRHQAKPFFEDPKTRQSYFHCGTCDLRFLHPAHYLPALDERARYKLHQNSVNDARYVSYMKPIADWIEVHCEPQSRGLDFGCGEGPALAQILEARGHKMDIYDPYFFPNQAYAENKFDFCVTVEAAEHFYDPCKEFMHLRNRLKPHGGLGVVTQLYSSAFDFATWYYRLDPTHVCFYTTTTFEWLRGRLGFQSYQTDGVRFNWLKLVRKIA